MVTSHSCSSTKRLSWRGLSKESSADIHESGSKERGGTDLPTGFARESRNLHPMRGASWARSRAIGGGEVLALARSASELDGQTFALELGAICREVRLLFCKFVRVYIFAGVEG